MIDEKRIEWNFAETAYWWLHRKGYGSEVKAIRAVRKRKGMGHLSEATVTRRFSSAVAILRRTEELVKTELQRAGHAHLYKPTAKSDKRPFCGQRKYGPPLPGSDN